MRLCTAILVSWTINEQPTVRPTTAEAPVRIARPAHACKTQPVAVVGGRRTRYGNESRGGEQAEGRIEKT